MEKVKTNAKSTVSGFMNFVREQGVVGLAVGLVLGGAVKTLVDSLVNDIVMPLVGIPLGSANGLKGLKWHVTDQLVNGKQEAVYMSYGNFLNLILDFLVIAAVVYFVVRWLKLDRLDKKKEA